LIEDFDRSLLHKSHIDNGFLFHHERVKVDDTALEESLNNKLSLIKHHVDFNDTFLDKVQILNHLIFLLQDFTLLLLLSGKSIDHIVQEGIFWLKELEVWHF
jgi:hypothetical protein